MTTANLKIPGGLKNREWIKQAIALMAEECPGISYEIINDMILVHYPPLDRYQTRGNMRFVLNSARNGYDLQYDYWLCESECKRVSEVFQFCYTQAGIKAWTVRRGFSHKAKKTETGARIVAVRA